MGTSGKRKESQSSSGSGNKQKASNSRGFQSHGYPIQSQVRASSQAEQVMCFHCQQPEHLRRDYPQRRGSQGFETVLSQSSVGQAQTQFIPPHPNVSQRN